MPEFPKLPPMATQPLSLVLLARDAEGHVRDLLQRWLAVLQARGVGHEVLLVDDGSADRTAALAEEVAAGSAALKVLRHETRRGSGEAVRTGLAGASLPLVAYAPCDPAYEPEWLGKLLAEIDRVHLISGFRAGRKVPWPWRLAGLLRRLLARVVFGQAPGRLPGWLGWRGHLGAWLARLVFGVRMQDVCCPFRLCRREILARAPVQSEGDFAHVELLAKVNFAGCVLGAEVSLPVKAGSGPATGTPLRQLLREASLVFSRPDFGPPELPVPCPPAQGADAPRSGG